MSDLGRVRSIDRIIGGKHFRGIVLQLSQRSSGHLFVSLMKKMNKTTRSVHQLVAEAFIGPRRGLNALHKNDNPADNRVENLYYGTQRQNMHDRDRNGRTAVGIHNGRSKLTEDDIAVIRSLKGRVTQRELGRRYGVSHTSIWQAQAGRCWRHVQ